MSRHVHMELERPFPSEVPVGADIALQVKVSDAAGSDLRGGVVKVVAAPAETTTWTLSGHHNGFNTADEFSIKAPTQCGEFTWMLVFPRQEIDQLVYQECSTPVRFRTKPIETSLAVWDVPSPVRIGETFRIKVGAKSSRGCDLQGARFDVCDETGGIVGQGTLGEAPWPGSGALYWGEIALAAPSVEGVSRWTATLAAQAFELPHAAGMTRFSIAAVKPPAHALTVNAIDGQSAHPIEEAQVGAGPYLAATGRTGSARIELPAGHYSVAVWKPGFEAATMTLEIGADAFVRVELKRLPEEVKIWG